MRANEILHEDATTRVLSRRNLVVTVWSSAPTAAQFRIFSRVSERFVKARPAGTALLSVALRGVPNFSESAREEVVQMVKNRSLYTLGTAHLILVPGLAGAAVRAFLSTVTLIARPAAPTRSFGEKNAAVTWLHGQLRRGPEEWTEKELRETLEEAIAER
ncbi:MAG: hypothetical protein R3B70_26905 [Polyangiaceae bacterium]